VTSTWVVVFGLLFSLLSALFWGGQNSAGPTCPSIIQTLGPTPLGFSKIGRQRSLSGADRRLLVGPKPPTFFDICLHGCTTEKRRNVTGDSQAFQFNEQAAEESAEAAEHSPQAQKRFGRSARSESRALPRQGVAGRFSAHGAFRLGRRGRPVKTLGKVCGGRIQEDSRGINICVGQEISPGRQIGGALEAVGVHALPDQGQLEAVGVTPLASAEADQGV